MSLPPLIPRACSRTEAVVLKVPGEWRAAPSPSVHPHSAAAARSVLHWLASSCPAPTWVRSVKWLISRSGQNAALPLVLAPPRPVCRADRWPRRPLLTLPLLTQSASQAHQWRHRWADQGHLCVPHRPGQDAAAEPAEWPARVHQHVSVRGGAGATGGGGRVRLRLTSPAPASPTLFDKRGS